MLTKIELIEKQDEGMVKIVLTDHSEHCYKHTLFMVQKVVEYGAELIEVNPYGCIVADIRGEWQRFRKYINDYICDEYLVEDTDELDFAPKTKIYYIEY